jgi:hypothetical protein
MTREMFITMLVAELEGYCGGGGGRLWRGGSPEERGDQALEGRREAIEHRRCCPSPANVPLEGRRYITCK